MPRFEPVPPDGLPEESRQILEAGMASGMYDDGTGLLPAPIRVMAYSSAVLRATAAQSAALWRKGVLDDRLKELIRIRSAQVNGCDACAATIKVGDVTPDDVACMTVAGGSQSGPREAAALDLVWKIASDHDAIDEDVLRSLLLLFSPAEIVELTYHACVMLGQHRFHHVFRSFEPGEPLVPFHPSQIDASSDHVATSR